MGHSWIQVLYADLSNGGSITYTSSDPVLVEAIHKWFDRQLLDHGTRHTDRHAQDYKSTSAPFVATARLPGRKALHPHAGSGWALPRACI
ncbi:MAG: hypothetical protein M3P18_18320 [Actinomycetota bacterium]|nr:hypothetical protein [Actinomycetota bacterium]